MIFYALTVLLIAVALVLQNWGKLSKKKLPLNTRINLVSIRVMCLALASVTNFFAITGNALSLTAIAMGIIGEIALVVWLILEIMQQALLIEKKIKCDSEKWVEIHSFSFFYYY